MCTMNEFYSILVASDHRQRLLPVKSFCSLVVFIITGGPVVLVVSDSDCYARGYGFESD